MTSQIPRKALNLPQLLSSLPQDGLGALVRPSTSPNSIFRITRSKLKFRQRSAIGQLKDGTGEGEGDGLLAVSGKVWGMRFVNGRYVPHTKSASPEVGIDSLIKERINARWTQVKEDELDTKSKEAILAKVQELRQVKAGSI